MKLCACPLLVWHLGEWHGKRELPPCRVFQNQCPWEGGPSQVAGPCFRGKSFRKPELSRRERKVSPCSLAAGAQIQSQEVTGFSFLHVSCLLPAAQPHLPQGSQS